MISTVVRLLNDVLALKTDVNVPTIYKEKLRKILIFSCGHLESHCKKEMDPDLDP
jgi:hypothetical protein